jgi:hypothetical protein
MLKFKKKRVRLFVHFPVLLIDMYHFTLQQNPQNVILFDETIPLIPQNYIACYFLFPINEL